MFIYIYIYIYMYVCMYVCVYIYIRDGPKWGPSPLGSIFFFIVILYFIFVFVPFLPNQSSQPNPNSNYPIQKLNKNYKNIHNGDCILAKKNYFTTNEKKKSCDICNYSKLVYCSKLLKIKYNILLRSYLFLQLKNSNSPSFFLF